MASTELAGKLNDEDTARLMLAEARRDALKLNPNAFSQNESVETTRDYYSLIRELIGRYEIDEARAWQISQFTGVITYEI